MQRTSKHLWIDIFRLLEHCIHDGRRFDKLWVCHKLHAVEIQICHTTSHVSRRFTEAHSCVAIAHGASFTTCAHHITALFCHGGCGWARTNNFVRAPHRVFLERTAKSCVFALLLTFKSIAGRRRSIDGTEHRSRSALNSAAVILELVTRQIRHEFWGTIEDLILLITRWSTLVHILVRPV